MLDPKKIYGTMSKGFPHLAIPVTVKDAFVIFKAIAAGVPLTYFATTDFTTIIEVPQKDLPLWIGSKYTSQEFENLLKGRISK